MTRALVILVFLSEAARAGGFGIPEIGVRRTAMDYIDHVEVVRQRDFAAFEAASTGRLVLLSTKAETSLYDFAFRPDDILLFGQESAGVPGHVAAAADAAIRIPLRAQVRSFNLATSAAMNIYNRRVALVER